MGEENDEGSFSGSPNSDIADADDRGGQANPPE
jgi:hypothetical protein